MQQSIPLVICNFRLTQGPGKVLIDFCQSLLEGKNPHGINILADIQPNLFLQSRIIALKGTSESLGFKLPLRQAGQKPARKLSSGGGTPPHQQSGPTVAAMFPS
jgi:hypothetical protein